MMLLDFVFNVLEVQLGYVHLQKEATIRGRLRGLMG